MLFPFILRDCQNLPNFIAILDRKTKKKKINLMVMLEEKSGIMKSLGIIVWELWMYVQHFGPIHLVDVEIFCWTSENIWPASGAAWREVISILPLCTMDVYTKCHGNPYISEKHKISTSGGARQKVNRKSQGTLNVDTKFHNNLSNSWWDISVWVVDATSMAKNIYF